MGRGVIRGRCVQWRAVLNRQRQSGSGRDHFASFEVDEDQQIHVGNVKSCGWR